MSDAQPAAQAVQELGSQDISAASSKEKAAGSAKRHSTAPLGMGFQPTATKGDQTSPPSCLLELLLPIALLLVGKLRHRQRGQLKLIYRAQFNRICLH